MIITNIQRMSLDDGPGMRTTVFVKGCPLRCVWCHNPECMECEGSPEFRENWKKSFVFDGNTEALCERLLRDKRFFQATGGGITISGGEPLLYPEFVKNMGETLAGQGVSVAVDTCGFVPWKNILYAADVTDLFLYDLKAWDPILHRKLTGQGCEQIWDNLYRLIDLRKPIWIRIPVVEGGNSEDLLNIAERIPDSDMIQQVNLLPYHEYGAGKYKKLGKAYPAGHFRRADQEWMEQAGEIISGKHLLCLIEGKVWGRNAEI